MTAITYLMLGVAAGLGLAVLAGLFWYRRRELKRTWVYAEFQTSNALTTLKYLRAGKTAEVIKCQEMLLDAFLIRMGQILGAKPERWRTEDDLHFVAKAKQYRQAFPRASGTPGIDAGVARALALASSKAT